MSRKSTVSNSILDLQTGTREDRSNTNMVIVRIPNERIGLEPIMVPCLVSVDKSEKNITNLLEANNIEKTTINDLINIYGYEKYRGTAVLQPLNGNGLRLTSFIINSIVG